LPYYGLLSTLSIISVANFLSVEENSDKNFKLIKSGLKQSEVLTNRESPITINQIRDIQKWVNQTSFGNKSRFVILEELESCSEGAANSLLKLLEEPPKKTYFIVIGENPAKLLATLLSRLRLYRIASFNEQQKNEILRDNYFVDGAAYSSLEEFILERGNIATKELKTAATQFCSAIVNKTDLKREELEAISALVDEAVSLKYFLDELIIRLGDFFKNGKISMSVAQRYSLVTKESVNKALVYNQNSRLLIDSLYYRLMGEV
jgi:DNA polymerase III delta prime subunit